MYKSPRAPQSAGLLAGRQVKAASAARMNAASVSQHRFWGRPMAPHRARYCTRKRHAAQAPPSTGSGVRLYARGPPALRSVGIPFFKRLL